MSRRLTLQTLAVLFLVLLCACADYDTPPGRLPPPQYGVHAMRMLPMTDAVADSPPAPKSAAAPRQTKPIASGAIVLGPGMAKRLPKGPQVLFLIARSPDGGPPLAVKRLVVNQFPVPFELTTADLMMPGTELGGALVLTARLDADGRAGPVAAGDIENSAKPRIKPGQRALQLILDKVN